MDRTSQMIVLLAQWVIRFRGQGLLVLGMALAVAGIAGGFIHRRCRRRRFSNGSPRESNGSVSVRTPDSSAISCFAKEILAMEEICPVILMASQDRENLPVTIPVQTAMEIAKRKKRCLLIDLDVQRDAIASVFDLEPPSSSDPFEPRPYQTLFKDLHVWPAYQFRNRSIHPISIVSAARKHYDTILLNSPQILQSRDFHPIASTATYGFIFGNRKNLPPAFEECFGQKNFRIIDGFSPVDS